MLQYVRRNIRQIKGLIERINPEYIIDWSIIEGIKKRLQSAAEITRQQWKMHRENLRGIEDRVVSFWKPYIRPIVRSKDGKEVEFWPKCSVSYVVGYLFLDKISHDAYHEGTVLNDNLDIHKTRFGKDAKVVIADKIYGSHSNREMLLERGIKASLIPLGRKSLVSKSREKWVKQKQRKRNEIEGAIGTSKTAYGLERLRYKVPGGEEINVGRGLIAMNLTTMLARI